MAGAESVKLSQRKTKSPADGALVVKCTHLLLLSEFRRLFCYQTVLRHHVPCPMYETF